MHIIDLIKQKGDLVDYASQFTKLFKNGKDYRGKCPIHKGDNPTSLSVNNKNYACFRCDSRGDMINFIMDMHSVDMFRAIEMAAEYLNLPLDEDYKKQKSHIKNLEQKQKKFLDGQKTVIPYLESRGFNQDTIEEFGYGLMENRMTIPIHDQNNRLIAFTGRSLNGDLPKYKNSKNSDVYEKNNVLYNMNRAKKRMKNSLYMFEGYLDAASAHQEGLPAVAYCSSDISREQIEIIKGLIHNDTFTIYLGADNDEAGQKRLPIMRDKLRQALPMANCHVILYPDDIKDANDCLKAGIAVGSLPTEPIDLFVFKSQINDCSSKDSEAMFALNYLKSVTNPLVKLEITSWLANKWAMPIDKVAEFMGNMKDPNLMKELFKTTEQAQQEYQEVMKRGAIGTGFPSLDFSLRQVRKSEVMVVAGYSGTKKTFMAIEMALSMALHGQKNIIFFSMEMSAGMLLERMVARFLKKKTWEVEEGLIKGDPDMVLVHQALANRLFIVDRNGMKPQDIEDCISYANQFVFQNGQCDAIFIDYLQYMAGSEEYAEISKAAKWLKECAKKFEILVVALSQLNRSGNSWSPVTMNMIRGAGDIEASADTIIGIYTPGTNPALQMKEKEVLRGQVLADIVKHRRGARVPSLEFEFIADETTLRDKT